MSLVLAGLVAGAMSGMFGIGGGVVLVPALVILADLPFRQAVAASLLFIVFVSPMGVWRHWHHGNVDLRKGAFLGLAGVAGVVLGEFIDRVIDEQSLILGFCVLLLYAAHRLVYGTLPDRPHDAPGLLAAIGVSSGIAAKLFGIGGGIVVVPGLVFAGVAIHRAVGTSLVTVFLNAIVGSGINLAESTSWALWAVAPAVGALAGTPLGTRTAVRTHADGLKRLFGVLLTLVALDLAARAF